MRAAGAENHQMKMRYVSGDLIACLFLCHRSGSKVMTRMCMRPGPDDYGTVESWWLSSACISVSPRSDGSYFQVRLAAE